MIIYLTMGSRKSSRNGRLQDISMVLKMDLSMTSMGAFHLSSPVDFRKALALLRSSTGWYVSGTNRTIRASCTPAQIMRTQKDQRHDAY
jgi:hypothetical protein